MKNKLKVMVPVDFSAVSLKAIQFLGYLMEQSPIDTHLVHVIQVNTADWGGDTESSETIDKAQVRAQEEQANEQFRQLRQHVDFSFTPALLHGGLTTSLASYAAQNQVDLVIMGTKGAEGWLEKLSGSEAQQLVRHLQVPVISIHEHASLSPIHNILWVADFEERQHESAAVQAIKILQQLFGAQIHLLQIVDQADEASEEKIRRNMQQFADTLGLQHVQMHLHRGQQVPAGVRNFNQESEMDLVCVGTHARKGLSQLFYGSVAETLVNRCIRPLLTYHLK